MKYILMNIQWTPVRRILYIYIYIYIYVYIYNPKKRGKQEGATQLINK